MAEVPLPGLVGTNPLGLLAAIGAVRAVSVTQPATLRWEPGPLPTAVLGGLESIDRIADLVMSDHGHWEGAPIFHHDDVKLAPGDIRPFLRACASDPERSGALAAALVSEGVLDNKGASKPSDLHFTAGQQRFLRMARELHAGLTREHVVAALNTTWRYSSKLPSFMWDVADDRIYALAAVDPAGEKKLTEAGAEWLALLGLTAFPVFSGNHGKRTLTPGSSGSWKVGHFSWSLWSRPIGFDAIASLMNRSDGRQGAHFSDSAAQALGLMATVRCRIRRSDQGGYGSFGPPVIAWQPDVAIAAPSDPFA